MSRSILRNLLAHPLTRGLDIDDPRTTDLRRRIVRSKPFLRRIYEEWYAKIAAALPEGPGRVLELGSGAGFLGQYVPGLITSEIFPCPGVDVVLDGQRLPLADGSLRAVVMTDVLHHLPRVRDFFAEAGRCVRPGGTVVMIEPWVSRWSRLVYTRLHHEPFRPDAEAWEFPATGPLSGANGGLPWILFRRDRAAFERQFPQWRIDRVEPFMPLRYLLSGGVSMRSLMPGPTFAAWRGLERAASRWRDQTAMFAFVKLVREGGSEA
jgi:SAM-dependent methyltransferase